MELGPTIENCKAAGLFTGAVCWRRRRFHDGGRAWRISCRSRVVRLRGCRSASEEAYNSSWMARGGRKPGMAR